ncbi:MAG: Gfo/Idh/MocA family oxidoreductase [Marinicaulis sp.]|nr:Gfo/Idh/MocA family oxidoreductase [Marinicaulis sp.]
MLSGVRIGVVGAGVFGAYHAEKYACCDRAVLTAVYDLDSARAAAIAEKHAALAISNIDDFLNAVDAVVVTVPASCHFDIAAKALDAGRHVFVEKPLTLSTEHADALIDRAAKQGLVLQIGHQERYVFDAVGLLSRDRTPLKIDCVRCGPPSGRCEDVSVVFDLMVHDIDLVRKLTTSDIKRLSAEGDTREINAEMVLENGTVVALKASRCADKPERRMTLVYDDGVIDFDFVNRTLENSTMAKLNEAFKTENASKALRDPLGFGAELFVISILDGVAPVVTGPDGRDAVAWAVEIEDAAGITSSGVPEIERLRA